MILLSLLTLASCATTTQRRGLPPLETVPKVELNRYLGSWFEIASFPQSFQRGCTGTQATYSLKDNGEIEVKNRCNKDSLDGPESIAIGRARVTDTTTNARLEVSFFGPFWAPYWVIQLGDAYEYAVVGHPSRDYLWILSRRPTMDPEVYAGIISKLEAVGYEVGRLEKTVQAAK